MITDDEKKWICAGLKLNSSTLATAVPQKKLRELFDFKYRVEKLEKVIESFEEALDGTNPDWRSSPLANSIKSIMEG